MNYAFFWPAFALVLLTFLVLLRMLTRRIAQMKTGQIHPQAISTSGELAARMPDSRAADNFRNLFETPVMFYAAMLFASSLQIESAALIALSWLYVAIRAVHSMIQCSYNKVMHRFQMFVASVAVLLVIWVVLALSILK